MIDNTDSGIPRVLVFTREIPQSINAGSQQLFRVFQGYPAEKLLVVGPKHAPGAETLACRYETFVPWIDRWVNTRGHQWVNLANAAGFVRDYGRAKVEGLLRGFRPDVVFTVMDLFSCYKLAWLYAKGAGVPLVTLTMDDPGQFQKVPAWGKKIQNRVLRKIYSTAKVSLGVSREMASWIESEFGKKTEPFYFGPPERLSPRSSLANAALRDEKGLTVGFAGSLHFYRKEMVRLLPAFEAVSAMLNFYGPDDGTLPESAALCRRGTFPIDQLWEVVQRECDALLLPYPCGGYLRNVFHTHFPTKLSEYLWQGMPVIITGPEYATGLRWGLRHPHACVALVEPGVDEFATALRDLRRPELRVRLGETALDAARNDFDPVKIRERFHTILCEAAR